MKRHFPSTAESDTSIAYQESARLKAAFAALDARFSKAASGDGGTEVARNTTGFYLSFI